ncbi:MAG: Gfo/Idh/MocA family oxidoreductase [Saprospiraceae bacterium]|nr:Gfo/Idh/MocA family oxidoreductase [Saprospiraceae bacterium]
MKSNKPDRRDFLKKGSLIVGGAMVMPALSKAHQYFPAGTDVIKVAVVGCGGRGTGAAVQALSVKENTQLVAMADAFKDRLDKCYNDITNADYQDWSGSRGATPKDRVKVPEENKFVGFEGYKKAIALADVVILTTPPGFRPQHFEECIKQGKHVFMEKPVAVDPAGVKRVLDAAEIAKQKKLNVVVGLQRRYQESYLGLMKALKSGKIGDIISSQVYWNNDGVWLHKRKPSETEMEYQMRNWYYFNWLCGDHITEQHIHNIDVMNWAMDAFPVKAQGMGGREVRIGNEYGEIYDHHFVEFEYANGAIMNSQCRHQPGTWSRVDEVIHGTKGKIHFGAGKLYKGNKVALEVNVKNEPNPYQTEHDVLFTAIANSEYKFADAEHGAKSTLTSIMGRTATYTGQVVTWDDLMKNPYSLISEGRKMEFENPNWKTLPPTLPDGDGNYEIAVPGKTKLFAMK